MSTFLDDMPFAPGMLTHWIDTTPVESDDVPCRVMSLGVHARVSGLYAEVLQTIEIFNPNRRPISVSLAIPLPDRATVCGYALDVKGQMVDGVVVPKEQARVAFESEQRRGADPGLVEAVRGNAYRTRVYPVPARRTRVVQLRYVAPLLLAEGGHAVLDLPMPEEPLAKRVLCIDVEMLDCPAPVISGICDPLMQEARGHWSVEREDHGITPDSPVRVALPTLPLSFALIERDDMGAVWFSASQTVSEAAVNSDVSLTSLTVLWDASGSRDGMNHAQEFDLLRSWCATESLKELTLVVFAEHVREVSEFSMADELVEHIAALGYDGGTNLTALSSALEELPSACAGIAQGSACVLFTDGLDTLGDEPLVFPEGCDVLAVVSGTERDVEAARQACEGLAFDPMTAPKDAVGLIRALDHANPCRFLQVQGEGFADVCDASTPGSGRRAVIGRLTAEQAHLTLGGDGSTLALAASDAHPGNTIARAWAAQHVARLSVRAADNADELLQLGRRFGVVSPATSLLVLEDLDQWVRYDIEPPDTLPRLQAQWRRRKEGEMRWFSPESKAQAHREELARQWADLMAWWERDFTPQPPPRRRRGAPAYCVSCGTRIDADWTFCPRCGTAVSEAIPDDDRPLPRCMPEELRLMPAGIPQEEYAYGAMTESRTLGSYAMADSACDYGEEGPTTVDETPDEPSMAVEVLPWMPDAPYLQALDETVTEGAEAARAAYQGQRSSYRTSPSFFLDCAGWFMAHGQVDFGLRVLSNLAELRIDDAALLRVMAWRLREAGELRQALGILRRVLTLRPEDSQSHRDIALVLDELAREAFSQGNEDAARAYAEEAGEVYRKIALTPWERRPMAIGLFAVEEYNVLCAWVKTQEWDDEPNLPALGRDLEGVPACDLRVTLAWDADETDIDIHVTEPSGEEAYYAHRLTHAGGRVSEDITDGYGPELYEIRKAQEGTYRIRAHYYASHQQAVFGPATCTLTVYTDWGRPTQMQQVTSTRLDREREMIDVGTASYGIENAM